MGEFFNGFPSWLSGKESTCNAGDLSLITCQEDPLEKEMVTHCSILAWKIPMERSLIGYSPWVSRT